MFSVVIPLYNKEKYVLRAVESVLSQSFADFELIIVDDGSVDSSLEVIKSISDSRIRIIKQANQGVGFARNRGIAEAKYDWVAFLDADDAWSINHLSELIKIINNFSSLGLVSTNFLEIDTMLNPPSIDEDQPENIRLIDYFLEASKPNTIVCSSCVAINKKVFHSIGGFSNRKTGEDSEYWAKIAISYPIAISDKVTAYYFRDTNGAMENAAKAKNKSKDITSLNDISACVNILIKESIENPAILKKKSVIKFINSRVLRKVKSAVVAEDFAIAKNYSRLALPQPDTTFIFLKLLQITPSLVLRKVKTRHSEYKEKYRNQV